MDCKEYQLLLVPYLKGEAGQNQREDIARHLSSCSECRKKSEEFSEVLEVARMIEIPSPTPEFYQKLATRLDEEVSPSRTGHSVKLWLHFLLYRVSHAPWKMASLAALLIFVLWLPFVYLQLFLPANKIKYGDLPVWQMPVDKRY